MPPSALPKRTFNAEMVDTIIAGVTKLCSVFKDFSEEARDDCIAMAKLHLAGRMKFAWNQARVKELFSTVPKRIVNASPDAAETKLPFCSQYKRILLHQPTRRIRVSFLDPARGP